MDLATIENKVIMKKGYKIIGEKSMNELENSQFFCQEQFFLTFSIKGLF